MQKNHTMFSEESGEIALSMLSLSQPSSSRSDIEQTRQQWMMVRMRYEQNQLALNDLPRNKKYHFASKYAFS